MNVLVMGGTQFNGLAVVHALVEAGHEVTILNRGQTEAQLPDGLHRLYGDRTDTDQMRQVLGGLEFDAIYDLTAYHRGDAELMYEIFNGSVGHYICASSTVIYAANESLPITEADAIETGDAQIEYGAGKVDIEEYLWERHADGFPATIVPFSMVFGPRNIIPDREQRMMSRLIAGRPILVPGDGTTLIQTCFVEDQAQALVALMGVESSVGERINITSPNLITDIGYINTIADAVGVTADIQHVPHDVMEGLWEGEISFDHGEATKTNIDIRTSGQARKRQDGLRTRFKLATLVQRLAPNIHRWNRNVFFSVEKLQELTGWKPEHDFAAMVAKTHDWYRAEGLDASQTFDWTFEDHLIDHLR